MGKLARPPILIWIRPNMALPPESGKRSYFKSGTPQEGAGPKEGESATANYLVVFPPPSEVLYRDTIQDELDNLDLVYEDEATGLLVADSVQEIWVPFLAAELVGTEKIQRAWRATWIGPAVQFDGWIYLSFSDGETYSDADEDAEDEENATSALDDISGFVAAKLARREWPAVKPPLPPAAWPFPPAPVPGERWEPADLRVTAEQAAALGLQPASLRRALRSGNPDRLRRLADALKAPAPALARRLPAVPVAEMKPAGKLSAESRAEVARLADKAGVSPAYLTRVLRGQGRRLPDGTFKPYALPPALR